MSFYTRSGDGGTTGWPAQGRLAKDLVNRQALGTLAYWTASLPLAPIA